MSGALPSSRESTPTLSSNTVQADSPQLEPLAPGPTPADVEQAAMLLQLTSSKNGTFYFAFGSNLSAHQMSIRCMHHATSSQPVALARLDSYAWIICQRGYANVVALPPTNQASDENTVWGIVYNMSPEDEAVLDRYEGHDFARNTDPQDNPDPQSRQKIPHLQGGWDYNKHYLPLTVTKWFRNPSEFGLEVGENWSSPLSNTSIRALVYVDEFRTKLGEIEHEYIGRMNRGIRESTALGLPKSWVEKIMRRWIPEGVEVDEEGYVGTEEGYVEAKATETRSGLTEQQLEEARGDKIADNAIKLWKEANTGG